MTQPALALLLGVSYATVNHLEHGRRQPSPALVRRIVEAIPSITREQLRPDIYA